MTTAERVQLLARERPDLLPWLRLLVGRPDGEHANVPEVVLAELVRRGLLVRSYGTAPH